MLYDVDDVLLIWSPRQWSTQSQPGRLQWGQLPISNIVIGQFKSEKRLTKLFTDDNWEVVGNYSQPPEVYIISPRGIALVSRLSQAPPPPLPHPHWFKSLPLKLLIWIWKMISFVNCQFSKGKLIFDLQISPFFLSDLFIFWVGAESFGQVNPFVFSQLSLSQLSEPLLRTLDPTDESIMVLELLSAFFVRLDFNQFWLELLFRVFLVFF